MYRKEHVLCKCTDTLTGLLLVHAMAIILLFPSVNNVVIVIIRLFWCISADVAPHTIREVDGRHVWGERGPVLVYPGEPDGHQPPDPPDCTPCLRLRGRDTGCVRWAVHGGTGDPSRCVLSRDFFADIPLFEYHATYIKNLTPLTACYGLICVLQGVGVFVGHCLSVCLFVYSLSWFVCVLQGAEVTGGHPSSRLVVSTSRP